jgi:hypothetical protein
MPRFATTVTIQCVGLLDLTSMTERTIPVTGNPFSITVAFSPRYWAKRPRRASIGSVISIVCMHHQRSRYANQFRDDPQDIEQPLTMIAILFANSQQVLFAPNFLNPALDARSAPVFPGRGTRQISVQ